MCFYIYALGNFFWIFLEAREKNPLKIGHNYRIMNAMN